MLPQHAYTTLGGMQIARILNGLWQLSGAHGQIDARRAIPEMAEYHDDGFTTWDLADHYGPAEDFIGQFRQNMRRERGDEALANSRAFTKWVPRPAAITRAMVEQAVDLSRQRMQTDTLDMLQFHWWAYDAPQYLDILRHLADLRDAGKIRALSLTNFDTAHLEIIARQTPANIVSNQVQYSIIDRRPEKKMAAYCLQHNVGLLTYGTLCGGLLSEKYLGQPEPSRAALDTASLRKYKQMIDQWDGWPLFQFLLETLKGIADKHEVSIANVATRYILDKPAVAGVIVGARLGIAQHREENARGLQFTLDDEDRALIDEFSERSHDLYAVIGDCGDEYR